MDVVVERPSPVDRSTAPEVRAHWALYAGIAIVTGGVLAYGSVEQLFDTNFYTLWEATNLLAGDRLYRDFYEWGVPLQAYVSVFGQLLSGYRLIGEFALQWTFIVAGIVIGFHLAIRLSNSIRASLATIFVAIVIVAAMPSFHFPKLFFYPVAVWVAWWYLEAPSVGRAMRVGLLTAVAFLYRHDHGVYIGAIAAVTFILARMIHQHARQLRSSIAEAFAFVAAAAVPLAPWAVLVQRREGLVDYVHTRAVLGQMWAPPRFAYSALRDFNPAALVTTGGLPSRTAAEHWLVQLTLLLPVFVLVRAARAVFLRRHDEPIDALGVCRSVVAAAMVIIVAIRLFREDGYFVIVLPLAAALGAQLLAGAGSGAVPSWRIVQRTLAIGALLLSCVAAIAYVSASDLLEPSEVNELEPTFRQLVTTPPIDALEPAASASRIQPAEWMAASADEQQKIALRYMHDCTRAGDRIFVTGSTPYQVGYYVERPVAGGQVLWHHGWRSDPVHERQSLGLLESQSVPFAFSTHDPVLDDLTMYPDIRRYFEEHYAAIEGSGGLLLVDRRREATERFGALGFPCFH